MATVGYYGIIKKWLTKSSSRQSKASQFKQDAVSKINSPLKEYFTKKGAIFSKDGYFVYDKEISRIFITDSIYNLDIFDSIIYKDPILSHEVLYGSMVEYKNKTDIKIASPNSDTATAESE